MTAFVALLRAVNVGGTGTLAMKELAALCGRLGFAKVRTYIQSGNVLFESALAAEAARDRLEPALARKMGKRIDVVIRTASELRAILDANPFPDAPPAKAAVVFRSEPVPEGLFETLTGPAGEQVRPARREIYIFYPDGMGRSKLRLPAAPGTGTVRNINTVAKLAAMAAG